MEKKEFQKIVKDKMKKLGFQSRRNNYYKIVDDDYLIGVSLDHHPFCKGYFVEFGVIYLPDEEKLPFDGWYDWNAWFVFTKVPEDDLRKYHIENLDVDDDDLVDYFEYDIRSMEELNRELDANIEKRLSLIYDKQYVLKYYREHMRGSFMCLPLATINKLSSLGDYDRKEVYRIRRELGYEDV